MGLIVGGLVLLAVLVITFMFAMFINFGITPKEVKELYIELRGMWRLSKFQAVMVVVVMLALLFSLMIAFDILTGKMQLQF